MLQYHPRATGVHPQEIRHIIYHPLDFFSALSSLFEERETNLDDDPAVLARIVERYFTHRDELLPGRLDGAFLIIIPYVRFRIKGNRAPCLGNQRELGPGVFSWMIRKKGGMYVR